MKDRKQYHKEYREKNKAKISEYNERKKAEQLAYAKGYREKNKEKIRLDAIEYRKNNSAEIKERRKKSIDKDRTTRRKYYDNNREGIIKDSVRRNLEHRRDNPEARCLHNMRTRLAGAVKDQGTIKLRTSMRLFGCSVDELKSHLEDQFTDGMTWGNYGINGWHVDHIRPCSSFDLTLDSEQKECFHYTNLQPLWAIDNLRKGSKYDAR